MKVAQVSTFRTECGVGKYLEDLAYDLAKLCDLKVFAENIIPPQTETKPLRTDIEVNYERCWQRYQGYETLQKKILDFGPDVVHFQFVSGVYNELAYQPNSPFQQFTKELRKNGCQLAFTLHDIPQYFPQANQLKEWYKNLEAKFFVMNPDMVTGLKQWYPDANTFLIPLGTPYFEPIDRDEAREILNLKKDSFITTQVGFYGVDKGMLDIVNAVPRIIIPRFKLSFAGGFHPLTVPQHRQHVKECIKSAIFNKITDQIILVGRTLEEEEINNWCSASDFLILNQQLVFGHSTSASAHRLLFAGKPIVMSDSPKLSEFSHGVQCVKTPSNKIAETLNSLWTDTDMQKQVSEGAVKYAKETTFAVIAKKHMEAYEKCN